MVDLLRHHTPLGNFLKPAGLDCQALDQLGEADCLGGALHSKQGEEAGRGREGGGFTSFTALGVLAGRKMPLPFIHLESPQNILSPNECPWQFMTLVIQRPRVSTSGVNLAVFLFDLLVIYVLMRFFISHILELK